MGLTTFARLPVAAVLLASPGFAQTAPPPRSAPTPAIAPSAVSAETPRAAVSIADYRQDDLLWENDRTAHRIYGRRLEATEPPSSSGIDAWAKLAMAPFMAERLRAGIQHEFGGAGVDFFHVGGSRGLGGLGIWHDNKLWTSRNYINPRIAQNGADAVRFSVDYAPWPVDIDRKVWETRSFYLPVGSNFTRMVSTINSDRATQLIVGIGISKAPTGAGQAPLVADRTTGVFSIWTQPDARHGSMGLALRVDPAMIVDVRSDLDNHLILLRVQPGKPFVYYIGATWEKAAHFPTPAAWAAHARNFTVNFDPARAD